MSNVRGSDDDSLTSMCDVDFFCGTKRYKCRKKTWRADVQQKRMSRVPIHRYVRALTLTLLWIYIYIYKWNQTNG